VLASVQASRPVRWQASDYERPKFDKGPDGRLYYQGNLVLEHMPNRGILERFKDLVQMRSYVHLPTFIPKWGPYNHMPHKFGNPPTLNVTHFHAIGPQSGVVEALDVIIGVGAIMTAAFIVFKWLSGGRKPERTLTKEWKEATAARESYQSMYQISNHVIGQPVTVYDPLMDPSLERDFAKFREKAADEHSKTATILKKVIEERHAQLKEGKKE